MQTTKMNHRVAILIGAFAGLLALGVGAQAAEPAVLTFTEAQTAGIDGRVWNTPITNAFTFDAYQRSVLLRFPGAAAQIAERLKAGYVIEKAEVTLAYGGFELSPPRYTLRTGMMDEGMKKDPPQWHVIAWALRKPWAADAALGPTFNASINGAGYWAHFGAQDVAQDRYPVMFGPALLATNQPAARLDVTPLMADAAYGKALADRLRILDEQGLLLRKLETYDARYAQWWDSYEWAVPTGGHGLTFKEPTLVVTLKPGQTQIVTLPAPTDIPALAKRLLADGTGGKPTAVLPTEEELKAMAARHAAHRPAWMPDWQWARVQELKKIGGGVDFVAPLESGDLKKYERFVSDIANSVPRYWKGWGINDDLLLWYLYNDMFTGPTKEAIKAYWEAWLMPDRPTEQFLHAQSKLNEDYFKQTQDWRGNKSFFRGGYNYTISTMNFNHTAAMGALLGGDIIGSERAVADGRHCLEYLPLRLWSWYDGTTQESIDHYYFSITVSGQKMFADFGLTEFDRLMGQSILAKAVEELTSCWHPGLKRFISPSGRTGLSFLWVTQGGLEHIIHTLSRSGTLHDVGNTNDFGMVHYDYNNPAGRVALQTLAGPWAPEWVSYMVDEKPIPYEMTTSAKEWGHFAETPLWKRHYLGHHYGLSSVDVPRGESVPAMAQWKRVPGPVQTVQDTGTLLMRYTRNTPVLLAEHGGSVPSGGGNIVTLQHKNAMILLSSPLDPRVTNDSLHTIACDKDTSLQTTLALFSFQAQPTWEVSLNGARVERFPVTCKAGDKIWINDGVSYVAIIPLPSTDLGRDAEVVISDDAALEELQGGGKARPTLLINQYNFKSTKTLAQAGVAPAAIDAAFGGFLVKVADVTDYPSFEAFQASFKEMALAHTWDEAAQAVKVDWTLGGTAISVGFKTGYQVYAHQSTPTTECFTHRTVNGAWPYLAAGIDRDSNLTQQGTTGRLEKSGAVLTSEPGRMSYLQTEPVTGTTAGFNPLPDPAFFSLEAPGGVRITADGRAGLLRCIVRPKAGKVWVNYGVKEDQRSSDMATALLVFGMKDEPAVEYNGAVMTKLATVVIDGQRAWVIPLVEKPAAGDTLVERARRAQATQLALSKPESRARYVHDWYVVGAFPRKDDPWTRTLTDYGPEKGFDPAATYTGFDRVENKEVERPVRWQRILQAGQPVVGDGPVVMERLVKPNKGAVAYAFTRITSDRERTVTLFTGGDQGLVVWINGQRVLSKHVFRASAPDQDKAVVTLKKGENTLLLRTMSAWEGWSFYLRVADEFGLPVTDGLVFGLGADN